MAAASGTATTSGETVTGEAASGTVTRGGGRVRGPTAVWTTAVATADSAVRSVSLMAASGSASCRGEVVVTAMGLMGVEVGVTAMGLTGVAGQWIMTAREAT